MSRATDDGGATGRTIGSDAREGGAPTNGITILVVDAHSAFRELFCRTLEGAGYAVLAAVNGEDGLRVAASRRPAVVFVDNRTPGIDGTTVIRKLRLDTTLRSTPCILLTDSEDPASELAALEAGADAFLRKDEETEIILARLGALLRATEAKRELGDAQFGPKCVMAVDPDPSFVRSLATWLRVDGYEVVVAQSGAEAIEMLSAQPLDCILLDGDMPGGCDTCRRLKGSAVARTVPIILMTAVDKTRAMLDGFGAGADDCIAKSTDLGVLTARIGAQLRRKQIEDEYRRIREDRIRAEERAARQLVEEKAMLLLELERKNKELEAFSYSLSHDLRAPLRAIDGFSHVLLEDYAHRLDEDGCRLLQRVRAGAQRMGELIDDMLQLSRVGRAELRRVAVDMSLLAREIVDDLGRGEPSRAVRFHAAEPLMVEADRGLLRILLENLLGNAWKFTAKVSQTIIELGQENRDGESVYFVRDNGAGFDMAHVDKLFRPFQRLHSELDFPGTGIGLATVHRIVERHGGRVWAAGTKDAGAAFFFTVPKRLDAEARPRRPNG